MSNESGARGITIRYSENWMMMSKVNLRMETKFKTHLDRFGYITFFGFNLWMILSLIYRLFVIYNPKFKFNTSYEMHTIPYVKNILITQTSARCDKCKSWSQIAEIQRLGKVQLTKYKIRTHITKPRDFTVNARLETPECSNIYLLTLPFINYSHKELHTEKCDQLKRIKKRTIKFTIANREYEYGRKPHRQGNLCASVHVCVHESKLRAFGQIINCLQTKFDIDLWPRRVIYSVHCLGILSFYHVFWLESERVYFRCAVHPFCGSAWNICGWFRVCLHCALMMCGVCVCER